MSALADAFCFHKCFPSVYNWDVYALLIFLFRCHKNRGKGICIVRLIAL